MPESKSTTKRKGTTARRKTAKRSRPAARSAKQEVEKNTAEVVIEQVTDAIKSAVNVPVGIALEARDRIAEAIEPFTERETAEKELRKFRTSLRGDLKRFDRRGNTVTNRAQRELRKHRNDVKRNVRKRRNEASRTVKQRRRQVETRIKRGRRQAETQIKRGQKQAEKLQSSAQGVVSGQSDVAQRVVDEVVDQVGSIRQQFQSAA